VRDQHDAVACCDAEKRDETDHRSDAEDSLQRAVSWPSEFGTFGMTIAVAGVSLLITTLEGSLLTPMLIGRAASMNQAAVFVGLLFWSWIWGV
jgi:predicted PurR-regulated permease PerM